MSGSGEHRTGADAPVGQGARPGDGDTQAAARTAEAIPLLEQSLADCERVLGTNDRFTDLVRKGLVALTDRATHDTGKWLRFGLPGAGASERGDA